MPRVQAYVIGSRRIAGSERRAVTMLPMGPEHAPAVFPLLNDWDVVRMLAQVPWPIAPREVEAHARRSSEEGAEIDDFALAVEETKVGCGSINLAVLISDMQLTRARWRGAET